MAQTWEDVINKHHPDETIYHEITWWIEEPLTIEQWSELDDLQCEVFKKMGIEKYSGVAGPVPGLLGMSDAGEVTRTEGDESNEHDEGS